MLYVGIDIAKHKHDIAVIDSEGTIFIRHLQIKNTREGFTTLQSALANLQKKLKKIFKLPWKILDTIVLIFFDSFGIKAIQLSATTHYSLKNLPNIILYEKLKPIRKML